MDAYTDHDALGLAKLVRAREVSPRELVDACIERIERVNPRLNAIVHRMDERARKRAAESLGDGPFAGVPFLVKDLVQMIEGEPTSNGSNFWRGWIAPHDTELFRRFQASGMISVAKTNTPELGLAPVTEPECWGPTRSPWDVSRTPGGSSGGSAAAVAAGIVPMASGGDGGGSLRIPAACCGLFSLKPTRGRTPRGPDASEGWSGFAIDFVISRSVRDSAVMLDAVAGPERGAPYEVRAPLRPFSAELDVDPAPLRIGVHCDPVFPAEVHPDCRAAVDDVAKLCASLGHHVEVVSPKHPQEALGVAFTKILAAHTAAAIREAEQVRGRRSRPGDWTRDTRVAALLGRSISGADIMESIGVLQAESRRIAQRFQGYDAILTPTLGRPPVKLGELAPAPSEARLHDLGLSLDIPAVHLIPGVVEQASTRVYSFVSFTPLANFAGLPSMNLPLWWNEGGLPIGTMFTARFGDESVLFRLAAQLEAARPWFHRNPPIFAS